MFTAALFTVSKAWKQPKCATNEWVTEMWHIHSGLHSAIKSNKTKPSAGTWTDMQIIILSEVSQRYRDNT